jgi:hypothetical protein
VQNYALQVLLPRKPFICEPVGVESELLLEGSLHLSFETGCPVVSSHGDLEGKDAKIIAEYSRPITNRGTRCALRSCG